MNFFLILLWDILSGSFLSIVFFKLSLLNDNKLYRKLLLVLLVSLSLLLGAFSPFSWLQYIICGLILFSFCKRYNHFNYPNFFTLFIVILTLLYCSLINYSQQILLFYLSNFVPSANHIAMYVLIQIINIFFINNLPQKVFTSLNQLFLESTFFRSNFFFALILLLLFFDYSGDSNFEILKYFNNPLLFSGVIIFSFLLIFLTTVYDFTLKKRQLEKNTKEQLLNYVNEVEQLYDEISTFRHDYINILFSLKMAITAKNLDQIEEIYNHTIAPTEKIVNAKGYEITKLNRIGSAELKSILYIKINLARSNHINVTLDIPTTINTISLDNIIMMRIVAILLDNAIENTRISSKKEIVISIFENSTAQYINISNSIDRQNIKIDELFQKSYSTKNQEKNNEHGWGLFYLKKVIDSSENLFLETKIINDIFCQSLQIALE